MFFNAVWMRCTSLLHSTGRFDIGCLFGFAELVSDEFVPSNVTYEVDGYFPFGWGKLGPTGQRLIQWTEGYTAKPV